MAKWTRTIRNVNDLAAGFAEIYSMIVKGLDRGPVVITLSRETRTDAQNRKLWPMLTDISTQCRFPFRENYGAHYRPEHWKLIFVSALRTEPQSIVFGMNGEPINMSLSTRAMNKEEFSELIEFIYATGAEHNVRWSEQSLAVYEEICGGTYAK